MLTLYLSFVLYSTEPFSARIFFWFFTTRNISSYMNMLHHFLGTIMSSPVDEGRFKVLTSPRPQATGRHSGDPSYFLTHSSRLCFGGVLASIGSWHQYILGIEPARRLFAGTSFLSRAQARAYHWHCHYQNGADTFSPDMKART